MTESHTSRVAVDLEFLKPFKASNVTTFDLSPSGDGTDATWTMKGTRSAVAAVMPRLAQAGGRARLIPPELARESVGDSVAMRG